MGVGEERAAGGVLRARPVDEGELGLAQRLGAGERRVVGLAPERVGGEQPRRITPAGVGWEMRPGIGTSFTGGAGVSTVPSEK